MPIQVGPKRKIFRGGVEENTPQQLELPALAAGILPGNILVRNPATFQKSGTAAAPGVYIYIANAPMHADPLEYSYEAGETVFGYIPRSRDVYLVRAAAGLNVPADAPLTQDAAGRVRLAVPATEPVIGYSRFAVNNAAVDTLIDMRIK